MRKQVDNQPLDKNGFYDINCIQMKLKQKYSHSVDKSRNV